MSTPAGQMKPTPDKSAMDIHAASHKAAMTAAQGHGDALAKLHASISQMMQGQMQGQQPDQSQQDPYANMPDPGQWVSDDPHGAAAYADQIMQRFTEMLSQTANQMAAPAGPPDMGVGGGPAVGGDVSGAY